MNDISNKEDIALLITTFYEKVKSDEILSPFFVDLDFEKHLPKMIHFWCFAVLNEPGYTTNVVEKHLQMHLNEDHFLVGFSSLMKQQIHCLKVKLLIKRSSVLN